MSFINNIEYNGTLPDGRKFDVLYTKELSFGCLFYCISETGRLMLEKDDGSYTDINYDGNLCIYNDDNEYHNYIMVFDNGDFKDIILGENVIYGKTPSGDFTFLNTIYGFSSGVGKAAHFIVDREVTNLNKLLEIASNKLEMNPKGNNKS